MTIPGLSQTTIQRFANSQSIERGERYYRDGSAYSLVQRGEVLQAQVQGSDYEPYQVRITFDRAGIAEAVCSCPYDWGGWCKHIVATLLVCLHQPGKIENRPTIEEAIAGLDRNQLQSLVLGLATSYPSLIDAIESQILLLPEVHDAKPPATLP